VRRLVSSPGRAPPHSTPVRQELVDTFANLADEKRIADQMPLFTPDAKVQVYMGDTLLWWLIKDRISHFTVDDKRPLRG
jgi:hypothetical protein